MKRFYFLIFTSTIFVRCVAQQNYCDFEGIKVINFGAADGVMDSMFTNPIPNGINNSSNCAKYIRSTILYDNFRIYPEFRLVDITSFESNDSSAPRITMQILTSAPVGTPIDIQLGTRADDNYPTGTKSEYRGITELKYEWHNVAFN